MRIIFTGGTGKAGRHVVPYLAGAGPRGPQPRPGAPRPPGVHTLVTDLTDGGQVFNALTSISTWPSSRRATGPAAADAVVHFAAIPRI